MTCLLARWLHSTSCYLRPVPLLQVDDDFVETLEGRQPGELQAELDGKLAALRRRAGALAAEDGPTRQVGRQQRCNTRHPPAVHPTPMFATETHHRC